ncbi:sodium-dependent transporter [Halopiger djelfimassiliensis]|uniref:sodium-dependent transporter n=1 Tax=Halopiger djelfimassiliensis TaxID=1293047 RepID=UPI000677CBDF|nr:sodium-dependent transporter [Halopiger djelfimassiliensis]
MAGQTERETWATRSGFILAAVGSAVGLGNIWRFPFITGQEGGAGFLLIYLLFVAIVGLPAILVEFVIGRRTELNPVGALRELGGEGWKYLGYVFFITAFVILSYYSVVAGWFVRYFLIGFTDGYVADVDQAMELFGAISTGTDALLFHALFMALTVGVVALGIRQGIELAVKFLVPLIVLLLLVLVGYGATLPEAGEAYSYYLAPDFGLLAENWMTILPTAAGQAFFTLSLGMGIMITYASYLGEDRNLVEDGLIIVGFDTLIAVLVGFVVFPIIISGGADPGEQAVGAIFFSLTEAFGSITGGRILGIVFFFMVGMAALSSSISLLEFVVAYLMDEHGLDRPIAAVGAGVAIFLVGVPVTVDLIFLDLLDGFMDAVLLVFGALMLSLFVGWVIPDTARDELRRGIGDVRTGDAVWIWLVRTVIVVVLAIALYLGVVDYVGFLTTDFADWLGS